MTSEFCQCVILLALISAHLHFFAFLLLGTDLVLYAHHPGHFGTSHLTISLKRGGPYLGLTDVGLFDHWFC